MALQKIKLKIGTVYQKEPNGIYYFRYQVNGEEIFYISNPALGLWALKSAFAE